MAPAGESPAAGSLTELSMGSSAAAGATARSAALAGGAPTAGFVDGRAADGATFFVTVGGGGRAGTKSLPLASIGTR